MGLNNKNSLKRFLYTLFFTFFTFFIIIKNNYESLAYSEAEVIPCGMTIGVKISTDGIMVLGTGYVNGPDGSSHKPSDGKLMAGDLILSANNKNISLKEDLASQIKSSTSDICIKLIRDREIMETVITPVKSVEDDPNKIGVWVRDSTQGIGTVTYYDPGTRKFGALGHGILDVDTKKLMSVRYGDVMRAEIKSVKKGKKGAPGELVGDIKANEVIGKVKLNNEYGLFGSFSEDMSASMGPAMRIGSQNEIKEGPAEILSNIEGSLVKKYDVYIESVNKNSADDSKGLIIRITDNELLSKTGGIVQGMSGCPIIQNNKIVGAVTHVFVQDPARGYGIFIEKMLNQGKSI